MDNLDETAWWCMDCRRLLAKAEEPRLREGRWRPPRHPKSHLVFHVYREPRHLGTDDGAPAVGRYITSVARGEGTDQPKWIFGPLSDAN